MFVQISLSNKELSETISLLNFATRVRGVELGLVRKQVDTGELQKLKTMIDKARQEAKSKDEFFKKLDESLQNLESKVKGKEYVNKTQQDKIKELESRVNLKILLHGLSEKQLSHLSERLKGGEETCATLQQKFPALCPFLAMERQTSTLYIVQRNELSVYLVIVEKTKMNPHI